VRKPVYRVPTMAEIAAIPLCGLRVASTFSGGGGSSLGYRMAGLKVVWANEFVESARETYRANFPDTIVDDRDVRSIRGREVLAAAGLEEGQLDVFDGSPPCSAFSIVGKREKGWGKAKSYSDDKEQVVDDLFFEYARLMGEIKPRAFVAENVAGLVRGSAKGYFLDILARLKSQGYRVAARVLDAQWLGVPQVRRRVIFVGFPGGPRDRPGTPIPTPVPIHGAGRAPVGHTADGNRSVRRISVAGRLAASQSDDRSLAKHGERTLSSVSGRGEGSARHLGGVERGRCYG
jgi:DNA (cytosine-5)-methyltransferase 1